MRVYLKCQGKSVENIYDNPSKMILVSRPSLLIIIIDISFYD